MHWFNNLAIKGKILSGFSVAIILLLIAGFYSLQTNGKLAEQSSSLHETNIQPLLELNAIANRVPTSRVSLRNAMIEILASDSLTREDAFVEKHLGYFEKEVQELMEASSNYRKIIEETSDRQPPNMMQMIEEYEAALKEFADVATRIADAMRAGKPKVASELLLTECIADGKVLTDAIDKLVVATKTKSTLTFDESVALASSSQITLMILIAGTIIIAIIFAFVISGIIAKPIAQLKLGFEAIEKGRDTSLVDLPHSKDEIGDLANSFRNMTVELKERIARADVLIEVLQNSTKSDDKQEILEGMVAAIKKMTFAKYAAITTFHANGELDLFLTNGMSESVKAQIAHPPSGKKGLLGHIQNARQVIRMKNMKSHPNSIDFPHGHPPMSSLLAVPIFEGERSIANIYVTERQGSDEFTQADEDALVALSSIIIPIIRQKESKTEIQEQQQYLGASIQQILTQMNAFSEGDLTVGLEKSYNDEIGMLFDGFNEAVQNIRNLVEQVNTSAEQTAGAAIEISESANQLAATAEEQSVQTHEVAEVIDSSANAVNELGTASQKIGEIIRVIDEIAEQTNLLALNAAIEAARAGDAGKGFAVVADEVRKLAERTTTATLEVSKTIRTIQDMTEDVVKKILQGNAQVEQMSAAANESAASVSEVAKTTEHLSGLTEDLRQLLSRFIIGRGSNSIYHNEHQNASTSFNDYNEQKMIG